MASMKKTIPFLDSMNGLKNHLSKLLQQKNLHQIQSALQKTLKTAKGDLKNLVESDLKIIKKKFDDEKKQIEKIIDKMILVELSKAKKFVENQKGEIEKIQKSLEGLVKKSQKSNDKNKVKRKVTRTKAPAAKTTKTSTKKSAPKKAAKVTKVSSKSKTTSANNSTTQPA